MSVDATSGHGGGAGRHVRARPRGRAARAARAHRRPLSAELRHRHRRRLGGAAAAPASTAPATARSSRSSPGWRWSLADGCVVRTGGFPAGAQGPDLTQLFVGSEGTLGVITRVLAEGAPAAHRRTPCGLRVPLVRGRPGGLPPHPAPRRHAGRAAPLRRAREPARAGRRRHLLRAAGARRGRPGASSTRPWPWSPRSAPPPRALDDELVERWMHHRNDTERAAGPHPQGVRGRHAGDRRAVGRAARASSTTCARR